MSEERKTSLSMGGNESKSHSRRKPTTSTGLLGRGRHTKVSSKSFLNCIANVGKVVNYLAC